MPLDATSHVVILNPLAAALAEHDVSPVTSEALAAHKRVQLRRFRPTFWYQHRFALAAALLLSILCLGATAGVADGSTAEPSWTPLHLAAGPEWQERWLPVAWLRHAGVPEPIADLAEALHRAVPGSALVLGELIQQAEVVDPYLLIEHEGAQVCLGVWDETGIVVRAC